MADYYMDETGAVIRTAVFERWKKQLNQADCLMLQGMTGIGKTMLVHSFAAAFYPQHLILSCKEEWVHRLKEYFEQIRDGRIRRLIVLDDFQEIALHKDMLQGLLSFFREMGSHTGRCKFMLLSRGCVPRELVELLHERIIYAASDLMMDREQIRILMQYHGLNAGDFMVDTCLNHSQGWPCFITQWIHCLQKGMTDPMEIHEAVTRTIDGHLNELFFGSKMRPIFEKLVRLSVFQSFTREMADALLGVEKARRLFELLPIGTSGVQYSGDGQVHLHRYFMRYLRNQFALLPREEQKEYYRKAAAYYEKKRDIVQAIRCYQGLEDEENVTRMTIMLAENADGCIFAREGCHYMDQLSEEIVERTPDLISAKAMLASYRMQPAASDLWVERLRQFTLEHPEDEGALRSYLRLRIALPHGRAETVLDKFQDCVDVFGWENARVRNVTPSGDLPSVLNGGIDFCCFLSDVDKNYQRLKKLAIPVLGEEAEGWADIFRGEAAYQRNDRMSAIASLTTGLSDANLKGNPRMQYAAIGVMAGVFLAEGQPDTAASILQDMQSKAEKAGFHELLPSISYTQLEVCLYRGNQDAAREFLGQMAEYDPDAFFITDRYRVYTAAKACIAVNRKEEALNYLALLEDFAKGYHRVSLLWKVHLLQAIVYQRQNAEDLWKKLVIQTAEEAAGYDMVRVIAEEGGALLPLWTAIRWSETALKHNPDYLEKTKEALQQQAALYPEYLRAAGSLQPLSRQERKVLTCLAEGMTNTQIALETKQSTSTVKKHISSLFKKLDTDSRAGAVHKGYLHNLI